MLTLRHGLKNLRRSGRQFLMVCWILMHDLPAKEVEEACVDH
jgi:hypothetical protein